MSLKVQKITATAMGTGTTQVLDVECADMDCLVVGYDMNGAALSDVKVDVQPYKEDGTTLMAAGVFIPPVKSAGPILSGGKIQGIYWYDTAGIWKVRVTLTNRNAGTQTLNMFSARCESEPPMVRPAPAYIGEPVIATGTAAAPGAGANIINAAAANYPAGWYRLKLKFSVAGAVETQAINILFKRNAGNLSNILTLMAIGAYTEYVFDRVWIDGTNNIAVQAVAAATASTVYTAHLEAQRIE